ncbi:hypothetical protein QT728_21520, partial [Xanthomonas citri pv. citri]
MHSQSRHAKRFHTAPSLFVSQEAKNTMAIKFRHFSRVFMGLVLLSMAGAASAQWEVIDNKLNGTTKEILDNQTVGKGEGKESSGKEVEKPKETLKKVADDEGVAACSASTSGTPVSEVSPHFFLRDQALGGPGGGRRCAHGARFKVIKPEKSADHAR